MTRNGHRRDFIVRQHTGSVYVVLFKTGTLKIGQSSQAEQRIRQHQVLAERHADAIVQSWISPRHTTFAENEENLISFCMKRYGPPLRGREWFAGACFPAVVTYAEQLAYPGITEAEIQRHLDERKHAEQAGKARVEAVQLNEIVDEINLIKALANDLNRDSASEAAFQRVKKAALIWESSWAQSDPGATARYLATKRQAPIDSAEALDFEASFRALFGLTHGRMPASFREFTDFVEASVHSGRS